MQLNDYLVVFRKRWWLIGLVGLVAALAAYGISKLQTPTYRAKATYLAQPNRFELGAYVFAGQTLNGFIRQVYNRRSFEQISQQLQLDVSAEKLLGDVRLQAQPNDLTIVIEADSTDIDTPPRIIDAVGSALVAQATENNRLAEGQDRVIVRRADPDPVFKAKPQTKINTLAGGLLGLIVGTLLAFVLEYLDDTLKSAADIERFTGLTTLGKIPSGAAQPAPRRQRPATPHLEAKN